LAPAAEIFIDTLRAVEAEVGMAEMHPADHTKFRSSGHRTRST
jgi:hypothetical protein